MKDCSSQHWLLVGVLESGRITYLRHLQLSGLPAGGLILSGEDKNTFEGSAVVLSSRPGG